MFTTLVKPSATNLYLSGERGTTHTIDRAALAGRRVLFIKNCHGCTVTVPKEVKLVKLFIDGCVFMYGGVWITSLGWMTRVLLARAGVAGKAEGCRS